MGYVSYKIDEVPVTLDNKLYYAYGLVEISYEMSNPDRSIGENRIFAEWEITPWMDVKLIADDESDVIEIINSSDLVIKAAIIDAVTKLNEDHIESFLEREVL